MTQGIKHSIENLKEYYKDFGANLLEDVYKNTTSRMKFECRCGNTSYKSLDNFKRSKGKCSQCMYQSRDKRTRCSYTYLKNYYIKNGCKLLSKYSEYTNVRSILEYRCKCGNIVKEVFDVFRYNKQCRQCVRHKLGYKNIKKAYCKKNKKILRTYDDIYRYFLKFDCKLLTKREDYHSSRHKIRYLCKCGRIANQTFECFKINCRCKACGLEVSSEKQKRTYGDVERIFKKEGCVLLGPYVNNKTDVYYVCSCQNISKVRVSSFLNGVRCYRCSCIKKRGCTKKLYKSRKRFYRNCRSQISALISSYYRESRDIAFDSLGYSAMNLEEHLNQSGDSVQDISKKKHLDHIFPIRAFGDYGIFNLKLVNSLDNLQVLSQKDNLSKHCSYDVELFEEWLIRHNVPLVRSNYD